MSRGGRAGRISVRGLLVIVAVLAMPAAWMAETSRTRRDSCLPVADNHARIGAEYDRTMLRLADWHDHMASVFARDASRAFGKRPGNREIPPSGWEPEP
jgi:hypothetical protein